MTISHRPITLNVHGGDGFVDGISHVAILVDEHNHLILSVDEWRDLVNLCAPWVPRFAPSIPRRRWWQRRA